MVELAGGSLKLDSRFLLGEGWGGGGNEAAEICLEVFFPVKKKKKNKKTLNSFFCKQVTQSMKSLLHQNCQEYVSLHIPLQIYRSCGQQEGGNMKS